VASVTGQPAAGAAQLAAGHQQPQGQGHGDANSAGWAGRAGRGHPHSATAPAGFEAQTARKARGGTAALV